MVLILQVGIALALLVVGWRAFQMFRTGTIKTFDTDGPVVLITRQDKPFAYWTFIVSFYMVLVAVAAVTTKL